MIVLVSCPFILVTYLNWGIRQMIKIDSIYLFDRVLEIHKMQTIAFAHSSVLREWQTSYANLEVRRWVTKICENVLAM